MVIESAQMRREIELRTRAATQLGGDDMQRQARLSSTAALRVLHALASSPATAADAIALLHELQVHQVELDLQYEELQGSNSELEASLDRQARLYDHAPVALFSIDSTLVLTELNLAGARLLGQARPALLGQSLIQYLTSNSASLLPDTLQRIRSGHDSQACTLELLRNDAAPVAMHAALNAIPSSAGFQLALSPILVC